MRKESNGQLHHGLWLVDACVRFPEWFILFLGSLGASRSENECVWVCMMSLFPPSCRSKTLTFICFAQQEVGKLVAVIGDEVSIESYCSGLIWCLWIMLLRNYRYVWKRSSLQWPLKFRRTFLTTLSCAIGHCHWLPSRWSRAPHGQWL